MSSDTDIRHKELGYFAINATEGRQTDYLCYLIITVQEVDDAMCVRCMFVELWMSPGLRTCGMLSLYHCVIFSPPGGLYVDVRFLFTHIN